MDGMVQELDCMMQQHKIIDASLQKLSKEGCTCYVLSSMLILNALLKYLL